MFNKFYKVKATFWMYFKVDHGVKTTTLALNTESIKIKSFCLKLWLINNQNSVHWANQKKLEKAEEIKQKTLTINPFYWSFSV